MKKLTTKDYLECLILALLLTICTGCTTFYKGTYPDGVLKMPCPAGYHIWVKEYKTQEVFTKMEARCIKNVDQVQQDKINDAAWMSLKPNGGKVVIK